MKVDIKKRTIAASTLNRSCQKSLTNTSVGKIFTVSRHRKCFDVLQFHEIFFRIFKIRNLIEAL